MHEPQNPSNQIKKITDTYFVHYDNDFFFRIYEFMNNICFNINHVTVSAHSHACTSSALSVSDSQR